MKNMNKTFRKIGTAIMGLALVAGLSTSCSNGDWEDYLQGGIGGGIGQGGNNGLRRRGGDSFHLIIYSGWRKLSFFVDQRQTGGGGCRSISGMGGAHSAGRYVGICLRWHLCGHHPVEVYALFHRCSFCFILRNVFRPSSFVGQSRPVACLYSLPRFEGYRIIRHLP